MREVADGVWRLEGSGVANVYLVGDVLVDAGTPLDARRILDQVRGRRVVAHVITHAHPDHMGSSHAVCRELGIPFWVGEEDVPFAAEPGRQATAFTRLPRNPLGDLAMRVLSGRGLLADEALREGDDVAGFEVLHVPGHTNGHIALWRASDRVLIGGDVLWNVEVLGGRPGLIAPFRPVNSRPGSVADSARRVARLRPSVGCFGHGPIVRDPARYDRFL